VINFANIGLIWIYTNPHGLILMFALLFGLLVDFLKIKVNRRIKNIIRQMLGYSIAVAILLIIFADIWIKITTFIIMLMVYMGLRQTRKHKKHNKCKTCPELESNSPCSGFKLMVDTEIEFSKKAGDILQKKYYPDKTN
jgi:predicted membrane protein